MSRKAWTLHSILQELRKYPQKACGWGQLKGNLIQVLNERDIWNGGNFCLLWSVILKSVWYKVGHTFYLWYSWPWVVVSYTYCSLLLCPEMDWSTVLASPGKQGYVLVFVLKDFKSGVLIFLPYHKSVCQHVQLFCDLVSKWNFLNKSNLSQKNFVYRIY